LKRKFEDFDDSDVVDDNIVYDIIQQDAKKQSDLAVVANVVASLLDKVCNDEPKNKPSNQRKRYNTVKSRIERDKAKHPLLDPCVPTEPDSKKGCVKKCTENITEERRKDIHEYFWNLTKEKQFIWISHMVETINSVRPRKNTKSQKERLLLLLRENIIGKSLRLPEDVPFYSRSYYR